MTLTFDPFLCRFNKYPPWGSQNIWCGDPFFPHQHLHWTSCRKPPWQAAYRIISWYPSQLESEAGYNGDNKDMSHLEHISLPGMTYVGPPKVEAENNLREKMPLKQMQTPSCKFTKGINKMDASLRKDTPMSLTAGVVARSRLVIHPTLSQNVTSLRSSDILNGWIHTSCCQLFHLKRPGRLVHRAGLSSLGMYRMQLVIPCGSTLTDRIWKIRVLQEPE